MEDERCPTINEDVALNLFQRFASTDVTDEGVAHAIMECGNTFWKYAVELWDNFAMHSGRDHIITYDIQLHMHKIGLARSSSDYSQSVRTYLPLDLANELLDVPQFRKPCGEKHSRKHRHRSQHKVKNPNSTVISSGQLYARRKLFNQSSRRPKY